MQDILASPGITPELISLALTISLRILPMVILIPLGRVHFHWQVKLAMSLLLVLLLTAFHSNNAELLNITQQQILPPLPILIGECLIGLALGATILVTIESIQLGAQWMGLSSGVSLRNQDNQSPLAKLVSFTVIAGLITAGLHRIVIAALLDCYSWLPAGSLSMDSFSGEWIQHLSTTMTWAFVLGIKLASPIMITMLAANLTTGWISRQAPQFHQFVIGIPANTAILLTVVMLTLGTVTLAMQQEITLMLDRVTSPLF